MPSSEVAALITQIWWFQRSVYVRFNTFHSTLVSITPQVHAPGAGRVAQ